MDIETTDTKSTSTETTASAQETASTAAPFKSFATEAEFNSYRDKEIQRAVKANETNAQEKAKKALEEQTMTEAQKFQALSDEIKAERELVKKERAEVAAKAVLTKLGIKEEDYEDLLENIVSSDVDATKAKAEKLGQRILAIAKGLSTKQIQDEMKGSSTPANAQSNQATGKVSQAEFISHITDVKWMQTNMEAVSKGLADGTLHK